MRLTKKLETVLHSTEKEAITYHRCNADIDDCIRDLTKYDTIEQSIILQELRIRRMISVGVLAEFDRIAKHALSAREYGFYRQRAAIMISPLLLLDE